MLDWNNPDSHITPNFTVREALLLPSWGVLHKPTEEEKANIIRMAHTMEQVREYLNDNPININCWIRPLVVNCDNPHYNGKNYNKLVGGAENSAHIQGLACDFTVSRITCDDARHLLEDALEAFGLRMERRPGSHWVHLDTRECAKGQKRYFRP